MSTSLKAVKLGKLVFDATKFFAAKEFIEARLGPELSKSSLYRLNAQLISKIIDRTPVDTGEARAGWYAAADELDVPTIGGPDPGAVARGRAQGSIRISKSRGRVVFEIENRVPHIRALEMGSSKQAPNGMVRISVLELQGKAAAEINVDVAKVWNASGMSIQTIG